MADQTALTHDLSLVEVYFLLNQKEGSYKLLLQYTLSDLVANRVLVVEPVFKSTKKTNKLSRIGHIRFRLGSNYGSYKVLPHEEIFLSPFKGDIDLKMYFKHYILVLHEKIGTKGFFIRELLLKTLEQHGLYANNKLRSIFGMKPILTSAGQNRKLALMKYMTAKEEEIRPLLQTSSIEIIELVKGLGTSVLLLGVTADELQTYFEGVAKGNTESTSAFEALFPNGWYHLNREFEMRFDSLFAGGVRSVFQGFIKADVGCGGCGA